MASGLALDISQYLEEPQARRWTLPVEHLSQSSIGMFVRCPEQFRNRYLLGRKERPGEALVVGTAVHLAAEENFKQKIETYEDLPAAHLIQWYDDVGFPQAVEERGQDEIAWDTSPEGARRRGRAITGAYHGAVAPRVQPVSVETRVEADFGLPVPIIGYADVFTVARVIDIKTARSAKRTIKPGWRLQAAIYGTITGLPIDFHCVSASEKQMRPTIYTPKEAPELSVWLPPEAREETKRNVQQTAWLMQYLMEELGPDVPWPTNGTAHEWACNWCGYRPGCPAWKGME